jgi:hypothetical protein
MIKEAGTYVAKAAEVTLGESLKRGTPFVGVIFVVTDGDQKGQRLRWEGYLTDNTAERTIESLQHCGWRGDDISVFAKGDLDGLDANEVDLVVEMEEYEKDGELKEAPKVQWVNRRGGGVRFMGEAVNPGKAAAFGKKYRGLAISLRAKSGGGAPKQEPRRPAQQSTGRQDFGGDYAGSKDDEIPF